MALVDKINLGGLVMNTIQAIKMIEGVLPLDKIIIKTEGSSHCIVKHKLTVKHGVFNCFSIQYAGGFISSNAITDFKIIKTHPRQLYKLSQGKGSTAKLAGDQLETLGFGYGA